MTYTDHHGLQFRLYELTDLLSAGCDIDFDEHEELDREFQELRLQLNSFQ
ncbi:hypothetical protein SH668x_002358 [Planctomicrobium sp. SH668]